MNVMNISLVLNQHLFGFVQLVADFTFLPDPMSVGHVFSVAVVLLELFRTNVTFVLWVRGFVRMCVLHVASEVAY